MNYGDIEDILVDYLKPKMEPQGYEVEAMPQVQADLDRNVSKPRITIQYMSSTFKDATSSVRDQQETMAFAIIFRGRRLRGEKGIYAVIEDVKNALFGFRNDKIGPFMFHKMELGDYDKDTNTWGFILEAKATTWLTFEPDPLPDSKLTTATFN